MAFHPLATFRKNQKFWMASLILLCMVTFVICAGTGGDFGTRLIDALTNWGRGQGTTVATLFNRSVGLTELEKLREQRNVANEYMREASRRVLEHVENLKKDIDKVKASERQNRLLILKTIAEDLQARLKTPHYFETGTKVDDLLDFLIWRKETERLGIRLTAEATKSEINSNIHFLLRQGEDQENWAYLFTRDDSLLVEQKVRNSHFVANGDYIMRALREEFEVRIAKLALAAIRPGSLLSPYGIKGGYSFYSPYQWRQAPSPEQVWDYYKQQRAESDYALLVLPVSTFIAKVKENPKDRPSERDLQELFDKYKTREYDPKSITPGFKEPERMKIEWVTADPDSPQYRAAAETLLALQQTPPTSGPFAPQLAAAVRLAAGRPALNASLYRNYKELLAQKRFYRAESMLDPGFPMEWYRHFDQPAGAASLVALALPAAAPGSPPLTDVLGAVYGDQAAAVALNAKRLAPEVAKEVKKRVPWFATMFLNSTTLASQMGIGGASELWWTAPVYAEARKAEAVEQYLPFEAVRPDLLQALRYKYARELVMANMTYVRTKLMQDAGNPRYLPKRLEELEKRFGLIHHATKQFRNRYDIADDPDLRQFKELYEEGNTIAFINNSQGRNGTEAMLKPDEFWRLFFDPTDEFSIRNAGLFEPRAWPPVEVEVKNQLNPAAEKTKLELWKKPELVREPILFWKTANEPTRAPADLNAIRKEVEHYWYFLKARKYLLDNEAKAVAEEVQKSVNDLKLATLTAEAERRGLRVLKVENVAPLVPDNNDPEKGVINYVPYTLPKNDIPYPRPDAVKDLLALRDLKQPVEIAVPADAPKGDPAKLLIEDVNKLNKELLARKIPGHQVQILANQPMNVFYVALVTKVQQPNSPEIFAKFYRSYEWAVPGRENMRSHPLDQLLSRSQEVVGQQFERELIVQLRQQYGYEIQNPEEQKKFDDLER